MTHQKGSPAPTAEADRKPGDSESSKTAPQQPPNSGGGPSTSEEVHVHSTQAPVSDSTPPTSKEQQQQPTPPPDRTVSPPTYQASPWTTFILRGSAPSNNERRHNFTSLESMLAGNPPSWSRAPVRILDGQWYAQGVRQSVRRRPYPRGGDLASIRMAGVLGDVQYWVFRREEQRREEGR